MEILEFRSLIAVKGVAMGFINKSGILEWNKNNVESILATCGVYVLRNSVKQIVYIGRSDISLRDRLLVHWNNRDIPNVLYFDWYQTSDALNAKNLEEVWIKQYKPMYNIQLK